MIMWLTVSLIVLFLVLLTMIGFLAKALSIQVKKNEIYSQWIVDLQNRVETIHRTMHQIDEQQMFVKDDDVGVVFQQIVDLIDTLNEKTTNE